MAIEASFTSTNDEFPLAEVFEKFPSSKVELDRVVPTNHAIIPYFWLQLDNSSEVSMDGINHPGLNDLKIVDRVEDEALIRIEWDLDYESVLKAILETGVSLMSAIGKEDKWTFDVRGEDQQDISDFQSYCNECNIPIELVQLHALSPMHSGNEYDLTEAQREALTLAYARGYFDSPRDASQDEVADELGITRQAFASRLRRGMRRLVSSTIIHSPSE
ncbi:helix-turn-helix domain-containing protein [Natrinema sp. DC36]|uniref:helix-turn-helix domain-containing protein n=1 Tax=Natrinema sp. DC36 TaxID=2878680 RepID=UPI001CF03547|nr:helix-turn-helix domain-containing protein [Natrinema sp. DC36]